MKRDNCIHKSGQGGGHMDITIERNPPFATLHVKVTGERAYNFEGLSSNLTEQHARLIAWPMVATERRKREARKRRRSNGE